MVYYSMLRNVTVSVFMILVELKCLRLLGYYLAMSIHRCLACGCTCNRLTDKLVVNPQNLPSGPDRFQTTVFCKLSSLKEPQNSHFMPIKVNIKAYPRRPVISVRCVYVTGVCMNGP